MKNRQMQALLVGPDGLSTQLRAARGRRSMQQLADALTAATPDGSKVSKWNSSKVSKFETGQQLATQAEIDLWADVTDVDEATRKKWHELREDAESKRSVFRRRTSPAGERASGVRLENVAALTRVVQQAVIPDLLQTEDYARAVWAPDFSELDIAEFAVELRERQKVLHAPERRFQFLIGEGALRTIRGSHAIMGAQLDRLVSASSLGSVAIGILPLGVVLRGPVLASGFTVYDHDSAFIEDGVGDYRYGSTEANALRQRLDAAWEDAVQGRAARKLILEVIDTLDLD